MNIFQILSLHVMFAMGQYCNGSIFIFDIYIVKSRLESTRSLKLLDQKFAIIKCYVCVDKISYLHLSLSKGLFMTSDYYIYI